MAVTSKCRKASILRHASGACHLMNTLTTGSIRRLFTTFLILFLIISGVAAYVQIFNQAFFNGPVLAHGEFDRRNCPPFDAPLRGTIYDRNGVTLARTVPDPKANC